MKKFSNQYKPKNTGKQAGHFWLSLLQWLRLLVLSFNRGKDYLSGIFFHEPDNLVLNKMNIETTTPPKLTDNKKLPNMKPTKLLIKWGLMLLLAVCVTNAMAQTGPYQFTGNDTVCLNETKQYGVTLNLGSSYVWSISPETGYTMTPGATPNLISVTWTTPGTYTMTVIETNADGCVGEPVIIQIIVNPLPVCLIDGLDNICPGSTNQYSAPAGMTTYSWSIDGGGTISGPANQQTVSVLAGDTCGTYTLKLVITDANGCTSECEEKYNVTQPPITYSEPADATVAACTFADQAALDAAIAAWVTAQTAAINEAGGCDPQVTNNYTNQSVNLCDGGDVTITWTITDKCDTITFDVVYTVTPAPAVEITCPPSQTFCEVADSSYTIPEPTVIDNCNRDLTVVYEITGATTRSSTGTNASGKFEVGVSTITWTVTDACGNEATCSTTVTINPLPDPVITGPDPTCVNGTVTYSTPSVGCNTYSWTVSAGGTIIGSSTGNSVIVQWTASGTQTVTVTETMCGTGCSSTVSQAVTVNALPVTTPITHN